MNDNKNQLPPPDQAFNTLVRDVHSRVFFSKLAAAGIQPQNNDEVSSLLKLAGDLRVAAEDPRIKTAAATDRFASAVTDLDKVLTGNGVKTASVQEHDMAVTNAAYQLAGVPDIYNSVLSLKLAEAEELAAQQAKA